MQIHLLQMVSSSNTVYSHKSRMIKMNTTASSSNHHKNDYNLYKRGLESVGLWIEFPFKRFLRVTKLQAHVVFSLIPAMAQKFKDQSHDFRSTNLPESWNYAYSILAIFHNLKNQWFLKQIIVPFTDISLHYSDTMHIPF